MKLCKTCRVLMAPAGAVECPRCYRDTLELKELHECSTEGCFELTRGLICDECEGLAYDKELYESELRSLDRYEEAFDALDREVEIDDADWDEFAEQTRHNPPDLHVPEIKGARIANHVRKEYRKTKGTLAGAVVVISVEKLPPIYKGGQYTFRGTCLLDTGEVATFSMPCGDWAYVDSPKKYFSVDLGWWELREIWEAAPPAPIVEEVFENDYQI